jgi:hypothetical protein
MTDKNLSNDQLVKRHLERQKVASETIHEQIEAFIKAITQEQIEAFIKAITK